MTKNTDSEFISFLNDICLENQAAVAFLMLLTDIVHFWDDLYDCDPAPTPDELYHGMWWSLVDLPRDPFYRKWFAELSPLVANAILDWRVANRMEGEAVASHRPISFIIRSSYVCILQQTALILGGPEWAERCGMAIRAKAHAEGFDAYLKTLGGSDGTV